MVVNKTSDNSVNPNSSNLADPNDNSTSMANNPDPDNSGKIDNKGADDLHNEAERDQGQAEDLTQTLAVVDPPTTENLKTVEDSKGGVDVETDKDKKEDDEDKEKSKTKKDIHRLDDGYRIKKRGKGEDTDLKDTVAGDEKSGKDVKASGDEIEDKANGEKDADGKNEDNDTVEEDDKKSDARKRDATEKATDDDGALEHKNKKINVGH